MESPYLHEEPFYQEAEEQRSPRRDATADESPYLSAFERFTKPVPRFSQQPPQTGIEEPEFEQDLASAPREYSLKDIADKDNLPDEIRTDILRDGKTDVNDLANRALWSRHADIAGQELDKLG